MACEGREPNWVSYIGFNMIFTRYEFSSLNQVPKDLDLRGAIAFTSGKTSSLINKTVCISQAIHNKWLNNPHDPHITHTFIVLAKTEKEETPSLSLLKKILNLFLRFINWVFHTNFELHQIDRTKIQKKEKFAIAHGVMRSGVAIQEQNHLDPQTDEGKGLKKVIYYVPQDPLLRESIAQCAEKSCGYKTKHSFAFLDLAKTFFKKQTLKGNPSQEHIWRVAFAVAALLRQQPFTHKNGSLRRFYCVSFTTTVFQSCFLAEALSPEEKRALLKLKNTEKIAQLLFKRMKSHDMQDPLSDRFWKCKICHLDMKTESPTHTKTVFDLYSQTA